jgi:hypothetical protein
MIIVNGTDCVDNVLKKQYIKELLSILCFNIYWLSLIMIVGPYGIQFNIMNTIYIPYIINIQMQLTIN